MSARKPDVKDKKDVCCLLLYVCRYRYAGIKKGKGRKKRIIKIKIIAAQKDKKKSGLCAHA